MKIAILISALYKYYYYEFFVGGVLIFMKFFRRRSILFKGKPIFDGSLQGWMPAGLKCRSLFHRSKYRSP